jgi:hypothetical protein
LQVLDSSNDQDHADGNVESSGIDGDDGNAICFNAPRASHGVANVTIHSQVTYQGTGVVNAYYNADMAMY